MSTGSSKVIFTSDDIASKYDCTVYEVSDGGPSFIVFKIFHEDRVDCGILQADKIYMAEDVTHKHLFLFSSNWKGITLLVRKEKCFLRMGRTEDYNLDIMVPYFMGQFGDVKVCVF